MSYSFDVAAFLAAASASDDRDSTPSIESFAPPFFVSGCAGGTDTQVAFMAHDIADNRRVGTGTLNVFDLEPPLAILPDPIVVECSEPGGVPKTNCEIKVRPRHTPSVQIWHFC